MNLNVIGAGTWGIVFASYLSSKGYNVEVFHRNSKNTKKLLKTKKHPNLNNFILPESLKFNSKLNDLDSNNLTIIAVASHAIYQCVKSIDYKNCKFLLLSKGFDVNSGLLPSEVLTNKFNINIKNIAVLSGPNHAEDILINNPTTSIVSCKDDMFCKKLQTLFSSSTFRIYTNNDIIGVQIGAAIKNVIAIAIGLCDGLNLGDNAKASIVSRGMNEIVELSKIYKIKILTLYGLSGLGDLVGTCYSQHSRNRRLGVLLSKGKSIEESLNIIGMISEGVDTSMILNKIIANNKLDMPICNEIFNILFNNGNPNDSISRLMTRKLKTEN